VPPREALILKIILNHPGLALDLAEEIAALELESPTAQKLRDGLLSAHAGDELDVRAALARIGLGEALTGALAAAPPNWCAESDADPLDAGHALRQALALHRRFVTLNREKRALEAEMAGQGDVNFDVNFARLVDIQAQLSALDGAEAAIEDFGAMSGRKG
jgi:DNA primase